MKNRNAFVKGFRWDIWDVTIDILFAKGDNNLEGEHLISNSPKYNKAHRRRLSLFCLQTISLHFLIPMALSEHILFDYTIK